MIRYDMKYEMAWDECNLWYLQKFECDLKFLHGTSVVPVCQYIIDCYDHVPACAFSILNCHNLCCNSFYMKSSNSQSKISSCHSPQEQRRQWQRQDLLRSQFSGNFNMTVSIVPNHQHHNACHHHLQGRPCKAGQILSWHLQHQRRPGERQKSTKYRNNDARW